MYEITITINKNALTIKTLVYMIGNRVTLKFHYFFSLVNQMLYHRKVAKMSDIKAFILFRVIILY